MKFIRLLISLSKKDNNSNINKLHRFLNKYLLRLLFNRGRPFRALSGNCIVDHGDDRLVKKCVGNGGGCGIVDDGGGGGGGIEETVG